MGFASLALRFPILRAAARNCDEKQGLKGAAIGTSVLDENFSDPISSGLGQGGGIGAVLFMHRPARRNWPSACAAAAS